MSNLTQLKQAVEWRTALALVAALAFSACDPPEKLSPGSQGSADGATGSSTGEYGDAPEDLPTRYPGADDAAIGMFPTTSTSPYCGSGVGAARTDSAERIFLGAQWSHEAGVRDGADPDGTANEGDDDGQDDGARWVRTSSGSRRLDVKVTNDGSDAATVWLNVVMDLDRSGAWADTDQTLEWLVRNREVVVPARASLTVEAFELLPPFSAWTRIVVSDAPATEGSAGWDGCGHFAEGEVEDSYVSVAVDVDAASASDAAARFASDTALDWSLAAAGDKATALRWATAIETDIASDADVAKSVLALSAQAVAVSKSVAVAVAEAGAAATTAAVAVSEASAGVDQVSIHETALEGHASAAKAASASVPCASVSAAASAEADALVSIGVEARLRAMAAATASATASASVAASVQAAATAEASAAAAVGTIATLVATAEAGALAVAAARADAAARATAAADAAALALAASTASAQAKATASASASALADAIAHDGPLSATALAHAEALATATASAQAKAVAASVAAADADAAATAAADARATALAEAHALAMTHADALIAMATLQGHAAEVQLFRDLAVAESASASTYRQVVANAETVISGLVTASASASAAAAAVVDAGCLKTLCEDAIGSTGCADCADCGNNAELEGEIALLAEEVALLKADKAGLQKELNMAWGMLECFGGLCPQGWEICDPAAFTPGN